MINEAQNTLFENMKKRLTNPFLFTYFWVFVTWNIDKILVLIYEPMKMSDKLEMYKDQWGIFSPFIIAFFMVALFSYLDVLVDYIKESAERWKCILFKKFGFKKYYTESEFEELQTRHRALRKDYKEVNTQYDKLNDKVAMSKSTDSIVQENYVTKEPLDYKNEWNLNIPKNAILLIQFAVKSKNGTLKTGSKIPSPKSFKDLENLGIAQTTVSENLFHENELLLSQLVEQGYFGNDDDSYVLKTKGFDLYDQITDEMKY